MALLDREGEEIEVHQGTGFAYCDVGGGRYGQADWIHHTMNGQGKDRLRPIVPAFAKAIRRSTR